MSARRLHTACAVSALALTLGGCVAAAIPVVAGGAILSAHEHRAPRANAAAASTSAAESPMAHGATGGTAAGDPSRATTPFQPFIDYALAETARHPTDDRRRSAILADPGTLQPVTTDCSILPPAVLIDLDPAGGALDIAALASDTALAQALEDLRAQDVEVFWISATSAGEAGTLRTRLRETGLDPAGRDPLLLMRRPGDRKQLRRKELSRTHCVAAIAGDERADFDELYAYLKEPAAASALEALIDRGWFLVPTPPETKED
ncbi:hypothetical protein V5F89_01990 [Pelagerythrobacter marensis]|uniref:Acid phosphatase n=1 Tax=Pelagerythrobacter marensis TaxID=543877 RepID=A0ABZ2D6C0_9SPHN